MKEFFISIALLVNTASVFAEGTQGGGGTPLLTDTETTVELQMKTFDSSVLKFDKPTSLFKVVPNYPFIEVSPDDMNLTIKAAQIGQEIPVDLGDEGIVSVRPDLLDASHRRVQGTILESGQKINIKEFIPFE